MNKVLLVAGVAVLAMAGVVTVTASRYQATIRPKVVVAGVDLGGLTPEEARLKLRVWWESVRVNALDLKVPQAKKPVGASTPGMLGITLDDEATVAQLPTTDLVTDLTGRDPEEQSFSPVWKPNGVQPKALFAAVQAALPAPKPAKVRYAQGSIVREPEVSGLQLDLEGLNQAVVSALDSGSKEVMLPLIEAPKRVPDEALDEIREVVAEFTTRFPNKKNRVSNIRLAAKSLDGVVLMPGDKLSFNETVGQRTIKAGYKEAGVYVNGRTDTGIGGGICQVSTTLYNAALLSDLQIVSRRNHSMPVAYVPVGRDATVNWGSIDLVVANSYDTPIAVVSEVQGLAITFRVLGKKIPGQRVEIVRAPVRSWSAKVKTVNDPSLPAGSRKVVEKGSGGRATQTTRIVYRNGVVVKREPLGTSHYGGGTRIVAVGTGQPKPVPAVTPPAQVTEPNGF